MEYEACPEYFEGVVSQIFQVCSPVQAKRFVHLSNSLGRPGMLFSMIGKSFVNRRPGNQTWLAGFGHVELSVAYKSSGFLCSHQMPHMIELIRSQDQLQGFCRRPGYRERHSCTVEMTSVNCLGHLCRFVRCPCGGDTSCCSQEWGHSIGFVKVPRAVRNKRLVRRLGHDAPDAFSIVGVCAAQWRYKDHCRARFFANMPQSWVHAFGEGKGCVFLSAKGFMD